MTESPGNVPIIQVDVASFHTMLKGLEGVTVIEKPRVSREVQFVVLFMFCPNFPSFNLFYPNHIDLDFDY